MYDRIEEQKASAMDSASIYFQRLEMVAREPWILDPEGVGNYIEAGQHCAELELLGESRYVTPCEIVVVVFVRKDKQKEVQLHTNIPKPFLFQEDIHICIEEPVGRARRTTMKKFVVTTGVEN